MKNKILAAILILAVLTSVIFIFFNGGPMPEVCFQNSCVNVEVSDSPEERARGLMYRESLGENEGMLFIFEDEEIYPFWMKNTLILLDIIWISSDLIIVDIKKVVPCAEE